MTSKWQVLYKFHPAPTSPTYETSRPRSVRASRAKTVCFNVERSLKASHFQATLFAPYRQDSNYICIVWTELESGVEMSEFRTVSMCWSGMLLTVLAVIHGATSASVQVQNTDLAAVEPNHRHRREVAINGEENRVSLLIGHNETLQYFGISRRKHRSYIKLRICTVVLIDKHAAFAKIKFFFKTPKTFPHYAETNQRRTVLR